MNYLVLAVRLIPGWPLLAITVPMIVIWIIPALVVARPVVVIWITTTVGAIIVIIGVLTFYFSLH